MRIAPHRTYAKRAGPLAMRAQHVAPSGQSVELFEVLIDEVGSETWLRFRFLAPSIGKANGTLSYLDAQNDFAHLCEAVALPYLVDFDLAADVVVIALLDRKIEFGAANPDATQYIEAFRVSDGVCTWEGEW